MKIFNTAQIRAWDQYTIDNEPITSIDLMDRAAAAFLEKVLARYNMPYPPFLFICGTGNNGGDGLAVARMLFQVAKKSRVWICDFTGKHSADFEEQYKKIQNTLGNETLTDRSANPSISPETVIIDALLGSGLSRPVEGTYARIIQWINEQPNEVLSIDLPSGLFADSHTAGTCVEADYTFTFETPKRAFFFPENARKVGNWEAGSIGLHRDYATQTTTPFYYLNAEKARSFVKPRQKFDHKGTFGHALLICGSYGKIGAALLSARACMRSGAGLLTVHAPTCGYDVLQTGIPEAMFDADKAPDRWTVVPDLTPYRSIGVGCGIGTNDDTALALESLLQTFTQPLVIDADALNLLSQNPDWWAHIPPNSILTPHPKEFERLFGPSDNDFDRNDLQRRKAQEHHIILVLKGAHTAIALPNGDCWFNSTGNPGMATGGSGDVLTGILTGLLAQQYPPEAAALLGVYLHGQAGDLAAEKRGMAGMMAGDIVEAIHVGPKPQAG